MELSTTRNLELDVFLLRKQKEPTAVHLVRDILSLLAISPSMRKLCVGNRGGAFARPRPRLLGKEFSIKATPVRNASSKLVSCFCSHRSCSACAQLIYNSIIANLGVRMAEIPEDDT